MKRYKILSLLVVGTIVMFFFGCNGTISNDTEKRNSVMSNSEKLQSKIHAINRDSISAYVFEYTNPDGIYAFEETHAEEISVIFSALRDMRFSDQEYTATIGDIACSVTVIMNGVEDCLFTYSPGYVFDSKIQYKGSVDNIKDLNEKYAWDHIVRYAIDNATLVQTFGY